MLRSIDSIDLVNNSFEADFYLWTLWSVNPDTNPSGALTPLNAIYIDDIERFEEEASETINGSIWILYAVHARFIHRWQLATDLFDRHDLSMRVGFSDPLEQVVGLEPDNTNSGMSPELIYTVETSVNLASTAPMTPSLAVWANPTFPLDPPHHGRQSTARWS